MQPRKAHKKPHEGLFHPLAIIERSLKRSTKIQLSHPLIIDPLQRLGMVTRHRAPRSVNCTDTAIAFVNILEKFTGVRNP